MDRGPRPGHSAFSGSGFSDFGRWLHRTNNHVIEAATRSSRVLSRRRNQRRTAAGEVVGHDPNSRYPALLKVTLTTTLAAIRSNYGDAQRRLPRRGRLIGGHGLPLGLQGFSVSRGIISARNRELSGNYDPTTFQTDAAIKQKDHSGGPLFQHGRSGHRP